MLCILIIIGFISPLLTNLLRKYFTVIWHSCFAGFVWKFCDHQCIKCVPFPLKYDFHDEETRIWEIFFWKIYFTHAIRNAFWKKFLARLWDFTHCCLYLKLTGVILLQIKQFQMKKFPLSYFHFESIGFLCKWSFSTSKNYFVHDFHR